MAGLQASRQQLATPTAVARSDEAAQALRIGSWAATAATTTTAGARTAAYLDALTRAAPEEDVKPAASAHAAHRTVTYWEDELVL